MTFCVAPAFVTPPSPGEQEIDTDAINRVSGVVDACRASTREVM